jgi:hypothetical protein
MLTGGCFCGSIRYELTGTPFQESNCHCSMCRRASGAPFLAWFSVPRSGFRLVRGEASRFNSSANVTRSFCGQCGTQLLFEHENYPDEIAITTCSLDDPHAVPPRGHIYTSSKLGWIRLDDRLPEYPEGWQESGSGAAP